MPHRDGTLHRTEPVRERKRRRKALQTTHRAVKTIIEPPMSQYLYGLTPPGPPTGQHMPTPDPNSGVTFAKLQGNSRNADIQFYMNFYRRKLRQWTPEWLAQNAALMQDVPTGEPMGPNHPSILKWTDTLSLAHAHRQTHIDDATSRTPAKVPDPETVALVYKMFLQQKHPPDADGKVQIRYHHAVAQAKEALQKLTGHPRALATWYGAVIRRDPAVSLPNDHELLILRACQESGLTPTDWNEISRFPAGPIALTFHTATPEAAAAAWAAVTTFPGDSELPTNACIDIAAKQMSALDHTGALTSYEPVLHSFYLHSVDYTRAGLKPDQLVAHSMIEETRHHKLVKAAPKQIQAVLKYAQNRLKESPGETLPQLGWEMWLFLADTPPKYTPNEPEPHGGPPHTNDELLTVPPLGQEDLETRTEPRPPSVPSKTWLHTAQHDPERPPHGTVTELKKRGWTERLIKALLGDPDRTTRNPVFRKAAPMRLYLRDRVEAAEQHPTFQDHITKSAKRRASAAKTAQRRTNDVVREAATAELLWMCPTRSLRELHDISERTQHTETNSTRVDFLITFCSNHEIAAPQIPRGKPGTAQAHAVLIARLCQEITLHWPALHDECSNRIARANTDPRRESGG